jgi:phosphoesterase RecJ-like protein
LKRYASTVSLEQVADRLLTSDRIAIAMHSKPDGDSLGSSLALARGLESMGKRATVLIMGALEPNLGTLAHVTPIQRVESAPLPDDDDLIVVLDTGSWSQLEAIAPWLRKHRDKVIVIDHHQHGDDVSDSMIVDRTAAATAQIIASLLDELGCRFTPGKGGIAEALYAGLATDTGWFRYNSAGPQVFRLAARLLEAPIDKSSLYQLIEETYRPVRLAILQRALASIRYARGGAVAIMVLRQQDFQQTGGSIEDISGLINVPMVVGAVQISILLVESEPGVTKISFRSKPQASGAPRHLQELADVNALAQRFGGGGHTNAAGARVQRSVDETVRAILDAVD